MHTRTFTNVVLTVIATLLLVAVVQRAPISMDPAQAVQAAGSERHVPQQITTDPALAAATEKVASANMEIAKQIGEVAGAVKTLSRSMDRAARMNNK